MPGQEAGAAIAGVLSGRINPGGKLPVQIPRHPGGQPSTYLQPPLGGPESAGISTLDASPLFAFGYGRSYTSFELDDLRISAAEVPTDGALPARRGSPAGPAGALADRVRPGPAGAGHGDGRALPGAR